MNSLHGSIKFTKEVEQNDCISFLDVTIKREINGTLSTTIYRKPTFSGLYLKWDSFVPRQFKKSLVNGLLYRAWRLCSSLKLIDLEFNYIRELLSSNGYPRSFVGKCMSSFLSNQFRASPSPLIGPRKKDAYLSLPFLGLQSNKLSRQLKRLIARCCPCIKLHSIYKPVKKLHTYRAVLNAVHLNLVQN